MAFTTPGTAVAGEVLTAAFWNEQVRDNALAIRQAQVNVQSTVKTDTFTMATATFTDVPGLSVNITPSSESSKILVIVHALTGAQSGVTNLFGRLVRNSTTIGVGEGAGSRAQTTVFGAAPGTTPMVSMTLLDSPNTTSTVTYKLQICAQTTATVSINRSVNDADAFASARNISTITAIEVPV